jgi:hypothetical protein
MYLKEWDWRTGVSTWTRSQAEAMVLDQEEAEDVLDVINRKWAAENRQAFLQEERRAA